MAQISHNLNGTHGPCVCVKQSLQHASNCVTESTAF